MHYLGEKTIIRAPTEPRTSPWFNVGETHVITKAGTYYIEFQFRVVSTRPALSRVSRGLKNGMQIAFFINDKRMSRIKNFDMSSPGITVQLEGEDFELADGDKYDYRIRKEYGDDLGLVLDDIQLTVLGLIEYEDDPDDEYE
jgi:hypothetical protein